jgi:hypothetical protein
MISGLLDWNGAFKNYAQNCLELSLHNKSFTIADYDNLRKNLNRALPSETPVGSGYLNLIDSFPSLSCLGFSATIE